MWEQMDNSCAWQHWFFRASWEQEVPHPELHNFHSQTKLSVQRNLARGCITINTLVHHRRWAGQQRCRLRTQPLQHHHTHACRVAVLRFVGFIFSSTKPRGCLGRISKKWPLCVEWDVTPYSVQFSSLYSGLLNYPKFDKRWWKTDEMEKCDKNDDSWIKHSSANNFVRCKGKRSIAVGN